MLKTKQSFGVLVKTLIKKGKNLSSKEIGLINKALTEAFGPGPEDKNEKRGFNKEVFFFVKNNQDQTLSLGCLKPVTVSFLDKDYSLMGVGGIVSLVKGEGYGKVLMQSILKYLQKRNLVGVGFCARKNTPFYQKCGFTVEKDLAKRFVIKGKKGQTVSNPEGDQDILYFDGKNRFVQKVLSGSKAKVFLPFFW